MVHHALIDGWSMALLHSRLARHYRGESVEPEDGSVDPISASASAYAASPALTPTASTGEHESPNSSYRPRSPGASEPSMTGRCPRCALGRPSRRR